MKDKGHPARLLSEQTLCMFCLGQVYLVNGSDGLCSSGGRRVLSIDWKLGAWDLAAAATHGGAQTGPTVSRELGLPPWMALRLYWGLSASVLCRSG